ncbi:exported hypothetical protein [Xanthomonas citri pv. bilvae]|nr:exported hypothetical protein [Xanthomonas citri pv. bilvae]
MIAVAAVLCGWAAAGAASAADALAGSPVPPLGAPRVGLVEALARQAPSLDRQVLALATEALQCARQHQQVGAERVLSVIDYSRPSTERRLWGVRSGQATPVVSRMGRARAQYRREPGGEVLQ